VINRLKKEKGQGQMEKYLVTSTQEIYIPPFNWFNLWFALGDYIAEVFLKSY
jgi:hypothetical protein